MTAYTTEKTGTISIENGSAALTGDTTLFSVRACAGGLLIVDGVVGVIASVESDTAATMEEAWPGTTTSDATYIIVRSTASAARLVNAQDKLADLVDKLDGQFYFDYDAFGTVLADRDAFDGEAEGFKFALLSGGAPVLYVRDTAVAGVWTDAITIKGETGDTGPSGADGLGDSYDILIDDPGKPGAGEVLMKHRLTNTVSFGTDMSGSRVVIDTNPTVAAVYSFTKNSVQFATLTIETDGGIAFSGQTTLNDGDVLRVIAPSPRDATLSGVSMTLAGSR